MTNFEKYYSTHGFGKYGTFILLKDDIKYDKRFLQVTGHKEFVDFMLSEVEVKEEQNEID